MGYVIEHAHPHCGGKWIRIGEDTAQKNAIGCFDCGACVELTPERVRAAVIENDLTDLVETLGTEGKSQIGG